MTTAAPALLALDLVGTFAFAPNGALTALRVTRDQCGTCAFPGPGGRSK